MGFFLIFCFNSLVQLFVCNPEQLNHLLTSLGLFGKNHFFTVADQGRGNNKKAMGAYNQD